MKLTIMSEPTSNHSQAKAQFFRCDADPDEVEAMIQADLRQRQAVAADPSLVRPRSAQAILDDLGNSEYNAWHNLWRQDRDTNVACSYEVWNRHGNQNVAVALSPEEQLECAARLAAGEALTEFIEHLIEQLPAVQSAVAAAVILQHRPAVEVAAERGVSEAAISKTLAKARQKLIAALAEVGVNSSLVSGLLVSGTERGAQEGHNR